MCNKVKTYLLRSVAALVLAGTASGCANIAHQQVADGEAPTVLGPQVRTNRTPLDLAYQCYGRAMAANISAPLSVGVGEIRDYTGKYSDIEGSAVTQGASPMLFSALFKLDGAVQVHERFDTRVAELELAFMEKRRLGTGVPHNVEGQVVPWLPYYGGSILKSNYYIVGGITELNYNIQSGGAEVRIGQVGPKARTYTMSVAADLRLVNTDTLVVESAVSVSKQITGYEVGFDMFRFFGSGADSTLIDISIGNKSQEPLQLGVRAVLEFGALKLLEDITQVQLKPCLPAEWRIPSEDDLVADALAASPVSSQTQSGSAASSSGVGVMPSDDAGAEAGERRNRQEDDTLLLLMGAGSRHGDKPYEWRDIAIYTNNYASEAPSSGAGASGVEADLHREVTGSEPQATETSNEVASVDHNITDGADSATQKSSESEVLSEPSLRDGGSEASIKRIEYSVNQTSVAVVIIADKPVEYETVRIGNELSLLVDNATATEAVVSGLESNRAIVSAWVGDENGRAIVRWVGTEPLEIVSKATLKKETDGVNGLSLRLMRQSVASGASDGKAGAKDKLADQASASMQDMPAGVNRKEQDGSSDNNPDVVANVDPLKGAPPLKLID